MSSSPKLFEEIVADFYRPVAMAAHKAVRSYTEGLQEHWYLETTHRRWEDLDEFWSHLYVELAAHVGNGRIARRHFWQHWRVALSNDGWTPGRFDPQKKKHPNLQGTFSMGHSERLKIDIFIEIALRRTFNLTHEEAVII